ncbi:hypothetical protein MMC29_005628 [Sticta canariensis]|nr:hypothetical protein [Sticta canariensis]
MSRLKEGLKAQFRLLLRRDEEEEGLDPTDGVQPRELSNFRRARSVRQANHWPVCPCKIATSACQMQLRHNADTLPSDTGINARLTTFAENVGGHAKMDTMLVLDMGVHMLPKLKGAQLIVQLLVPGLEERARAFPALPSLHHTAGQHGSESSCNSRCPVAACHHLAECTTLLVRSPNVCGTPLCCS